MNQLVATEMLERDSATVESLTDQLDARCIGTRKLLALLPEYPRHELQVCQLTQVPCALRCQGS